MGWVWGAIVYFMPVYSLLAQKWTFVEYILISKLNIVQAFVISVS